jgi:hypothetical protein
MGIKIAGNVAANGGGVAGGFCQRRYVKVKRRGLVQCLVNPLTPCDHRDGPAHPLWLRGAVPVIPMDNRTTVWRLLKLWVAHMMHRF